MTSTEREAAVADYGTLLRTQWFVVLGGLLVGLALAGAVIVLAPVSYESTASVLVNPTGQDTNVANGRTASVINLDTEAQLVTSSVVASRAVETLGSDASPRTVARNVTVTVPANTSVLSIHFTAETPEAARNGARAFAAAYLDNRRALAEDSLAVRAENIKDKIAALNEELKQINKELATEENPAKREYLVTQRSLLIQQVKARTAEGTPLFADVDPGSVITDAQLPSSPSGLSRPMVIASGFVGGLLLGLLGAVCRDRLDPRVRGRRDLERLGVPVLVPHVVLPAPTEVLYNSNPHNTSLRQFRNALLARLIDHRGSVLVTSASAGPEGATTAANLAATLARSGVRTALVCGNTEHNVAGEAFSVPVHPGLSDILRNAASVESALHEVAAAPRLYVVPPGADGGLYSELLQDVSMRRVLREVESMVDVVVLDVAPMSANADAQTVVSATQGAVLVTAEGESRKCEVQEAVEQIAHVNASMLGGVVVTVAKLSVVRNGAMKPIEPDSAVAPSESHATSTFDGRRRDLVDEDLDIVAEADRWLHSQR